MMSYDYGTLRPDIVDALKRICGKIHVLYADEKKLTKYARDKVPEEKYGHMPEAVVMPKTAEEISAVMRLANTEKIPVTPRGAGSGLSGGAVPLYGGISLSTERMNEIIEIDRKNLMAVVEPGVVTNALDEAIRPYGLFFAGYPMSDEFCYIGGNVAENAGGGRAIKYGVTGRYVHGLEVVIPSGDIVQLGGKRVKDVTGYDLVNLMVGSEGTLGIFTKIIIKLIPRPSVRIAILALFEDADTAISVVPEVMTEGKLIPTAIEFMDGYCFSKGAVALKEDFPYDAIGAALLFEVDGMDSSAVNEEAETVRAICRKYGSIQERVAVSDEEIERLWKIRKRIPWELLRASPHQSVEDIVVPISTIPECLQRLNILGEKYDVRIPVIGHAGDGNIHAMPMKNPDQSVSRWEELLPSLLKDIYIMTAELGGTISGEHGIGHKRRDYMRLVMSDAHLEMMRNIKRVLDPNNILNPGKIVTV